MSEKHIEAGLNQEYQLFNFKKSKQVCTVITTKGVPIKGTVESYDNFVILLRLLSGKQSMIYKHAVSTIIG
ncbi:RNA chaperone Hfq [Paenibacillus aurantiacus]|uniref:RNA chaperone Hfq n=1 Tax=Paenibacillus aurantiacus TaxID=1936118 RepID=A0ABV5KUZ5_9BACL